MFPYSFPSSSLFTSFCLFPILLFTSFQPFNLLSLLSSLWPKGWQKLDEQMINGVCRFHKVHYRAQGRLPTGCWGEGLMGHNVCAHGWAWRDGIFWSSRSGWNQPHIFVPQRLGCSGQQGIWKGECSIHVLGADHVHIIQRKIFETPNFCGFRGFAFICENKARINFSYMYLSIVGLGTMQ